MAQTKADQTTTELVVTGAGAERKFSPRERCLVCGGPFEAHHVALRIRDHVNMVDHHIHRTPCLEDMLESGPVEIEEEKRAFDQYRRKLLSRVK